MIRSKKTPFFIFLFCVFIGVTHAQDAKTLVLKKFQTQATGLSANDVSIIQDVVSRTSGVRHIRFQQMVDGIPILLTESSIHIDAAGAVIKVNDFFISEGKNVRSYTAKDIIAPEKALSELVKELGYSKHLAFEKLQAHDPLGVHFSNGGIFEREVSLFLRYIQWEGNLIPIWQVAIFEKEYSHYWDIWYDAIEGKILQKNDLVVHCDYGGGNTVLNYNDNLYDISDDVKPEIETPNLCEDCYEVFPLPVESPIHGNRSLVEGTLNTEASPYGWHDFDGVEGHDTQVTDGNNVFAFEAGDQYGYQPTGGDPLDFSGFPFNIFYNDEEQYEDAAITNVFYICNSAHDIFYTYGFDEASGNFQLNNYGKGGKGEDPLEAQVQRFIQPCNASMVTPATDGVGPTMLLNTCNTRDGSFDNLVIVHEYAHGVTERMTPGDGNLIYKESPSEGWSDWFGLMLTMQESHTALTPRTIGTYLRGQSPSGSGVRRYPYTMNTTQNPFNFSSLVEEMRIHEVGTVWATILWELTWKLIDEFGFDSDIHNFTGNINQDAGNIMAMAIVTEALRFTPKYSGFVIARNGIITAAQSIYGDGILCLLWEAFAARGLGVNARSGDALLLGDETSSFHYTEIDPSFDLSLIGVCETSDKMTFLHGGFPRGGVYSGPGVTDIGNGVNFSFDPEIAGVGTHEIAYSFETTPCFPAARATVEVEVVEDEEPPFMTCLEDITIENFSSSGYELSNYLEDIFITDDCSGITLKRITQSPIPGTILTEGSTQITLEAEDLAGNVSQCSFLITLTEIRVVDIGEKDLGVSPVPVSNQLNLENPSAFFIEGYEIWDMVGHKIHEAQIRGKNTTIPITVDYLSQGMYFLKVFYKGTSLALKIIKE